MYLLKMQLYLSFVFTYLLPYIFYLYFARLKILDYLQFEYDLKLCCTYISIESIYRANLN